MIFPWNVSTYPLRSSPNTQHTSQRKMPFTFANIQDCESSITDTLTKQFKKRYVGFYLYVTFKSVHCVEASRNNIGLVGTIFLTFQVDSSVGFGETTIIVTQVNIYRDECIGIAYTGDYAKQLTPLFTRVHESIIEHFMILSDPDTRQRYTSRFIELIHEELCARVLHPDRVGRMIDEHGIESLDNL